ncbi:hypothetical protein GCM10009304_07080 [Pseudomonas matsuisoli]|uniref:Uncharacterized protein n=1 Tax=Pseudomonas matsuisoli TaxID=1515666 RepID=A0A917UT72_9PSED|nr:hypothetical protein GCM10009304_07080 [Pseudomonas matsuisoli]
MCSNLISGMRPPLRFPSQGRSGEGIKVDFLRTAKVLPLAAGRRLEGLQNVSGDAPKRFARKADLLAAHLVRLKRN